MRNTKVADLVAELRSFEMQVDVHDPWVDTGEARSEYSIDLVAEPEHGVYDVVVIAVAHEQIKALGEAGIRAFGKDRALLYDVKYVLPATAVDGRL